MKRFDQVVLGSMFLLTLLITLLWGLGDRTQIQVHKFSWEGQQISVDDRVFEFALTEAINPQAVAQQLNIEPPLPGKLSWAGKNFFYTLTELPVYGEDYQVTLTDLDLASNQRVEPFLSRFKTRDRAFAYIGTEETQRGRLILFNLTQRQQAILTPADLIVLNFAVYPEGDRLLFSAIPRGADASPADQQLYTVTTGLNYQNQNPPPTAGQIRPILQFSTDYINGQFQLASNGQRIVIQRINREDPRDRSLWVIEDEAEPRPLGIPAEDFLLSPDAEVIAITQRGQLSLVPLGRDGGAIQAKEQFTRMLAFSADLTQQAVLKENNGMRSLYIINDQGIEQEILRTPMAIVDCRFDPRQKDILYCLKIDQNLSNPGQIVEEPFLTAIDLRDGTETALLTLPNYRDVQLSIAADGLALLFDQIVTDQPTRQSDLFVNSGLAVEGGRLWLLSLPEITTERTIRPVPPESLVPGYQPRWMP